LKALVTGASGFIGRYLVQALLDAGWECRLLARPGSDVSAWEQAGAEIARGDITMPQSLAGIAEGIDVVFHLAGEGHVAAASDEAYARFRRVNVDGVANLTEACAGQPLRKFVHFSSTAAMGLIRTEQIDENSPQQPLTPYQRSKREGELVLLDAWKTHHLPAVILRPCMVYGIGGTGEFAKMCRWMAKGIFPRVGRGSNFTPMVHVKDVVRAALLAAENGRAGETYLVVGESLPIAEMRRIVLDTLGLKRPYIYVPLTGALVAAGVLEWLARLTGATPPVSRRNILSVATGRVFNTDKAKQELGFEAKIKLADSAPETLAWFKEQGVI